MKKLLLIIFTVMLALVLTGSWYSVGSQNPSAIRTEVTGQDETSTTVSLEIPGISVVEKMTDGDINTVIRIPGASFILEKGMPELPKKSYSIVIPDNGRMSLTVESVKYRYFDVPTVIPSKGNLKRNVNPETVPYEYSEVYERDAFYPEVPAELSEPFILRDFRGITVTVYPVKYNPVEGRIGIIDRIVYTVRKEESGGKNILDRNRRAIDRGYDEIYSNFFMNYDYISESKYAGLGDAIGNMLIISAPGYMDNLTDYIYWKKLKGIPVELVDVTSIGNNSADIKNYIQNKYDTEGVAYVMLVGNASDVSTIAGSTGDETCDPMYSMLAGSDSYQDCYIGRFSTDTEEDLDEQLLKTINYERYKQDGADWYHRAMGTATSEGTPTDYERLSWVNDSLLAYTYTSADNINEADNATNADVAAAFNAGRGILNHIGHGDVDGFGTASAFWFTNTDIGNLTNTNKWPFIYFVACLVGDFDDPGYTMCCVEAFMWQGTTTNLQGAVAVYGASVLQSWIPPTHAQLHAMGLLKREETTTVGGMSYNGSMYMLEQDADLAMLETWHIFGDPSIDLTTDTPDTLDVTHVGYVPTGSYNLDINVYDNDGSTPIENALVCVWGNQDTLLHETAYTSGGLASININAVNPAETLWVTATKHNYKVYEGFVIVGAGAPAKPDLMNYFDYARVPVVNPNLSFICTDKEGDDVRYRILIDTDRNFSNPDSFTTGTYAENTLAEYTIPTNLSDNTTYWWKVKAQDPSASGYWSPYSNSRSFSISSTNLNSGTCSWYQETSEQFEYCALNNLRIDGDSV
ncbi:MAG: C25 family cysteine peptidase, partial [candidate division WOR-3 bacterium]|nr:C25 family cysteine peptidase [candidate division WOR-3 bacterium]